MPSTLSVSPSVPDKLVINGVDLLNEEELSNSQQKELQRYIDANAHLLGFLDKEKDELEKDKRNSLNFGRDKNNLDSNFDQRRREANASNNDSSEFKNAKFDQSFIDQTVNRAHSPTLSEISGKRKGVSWWL